jgi:hypothetical protein
MSLGLIRKIRMAGRKPAIVKILIGEWPGKADELDVVIPMSGSLPDLAPLTGVWVTVHWRDGGAGRCLAVLAELEVVGAKLFGASGPTRHHIHALTKDAGLPHVDAILREREALNA